VHLNRWVVLDLHGLIPTVDKASLTYNHGLSFLLNPTFLTLLGMLDSSLHYQFPAMLQSQTCAMRLAGHFHKSKRWKCVAPNDNKK